MHNLHDVTTAVGAFTLAVFLSFTLEAVVLRFGQIFKRV